MGMYKTGEGDYVSERVVGAMRVIVLGGSVLWARHHVVRHVGMDTMLWVVLLGAGVMEMGEGGVFPWMSGCPAGTDISAQACGWNGRKNVERVFKVQDHIALP